MSPEKLAELVSHCRDLGLDEYEGTDEDGRPVKIRIGPKPPPPKREQTKEEAIKAMEEEQRRHLQTQFAACHVVPRLRVLKGG